MLALAPLLPPACLLLYLLSPCGVLVATNARNCLARTNSLPRHAQFAAPVGAGRVRVRRGENRTEQKRRDGWMEPEQLCDRNLLRDGG